MYTVFCLLIAHTYELIGGVFSIKLPADEYVTVFLDEVVKKKGLHSFHSDILTAWKPNPFFPGHPRKDLAKHVGGLGLKAWLFSEFTLSHST